MAIGTDNVITTTPQPRTYDSWWVQSLRIDAPDLNGKVSAVAEFVLYGRDENGVGHRFPAGPRTMRIDDLFALAGTDPAVGQLIDTLVNTLGALAKARQVIT